MSKVFKVNEKYMLGELTSAVLISYSLSRQINILYLSKILCKCFNLFTINDDLQPFHLQLL